MQTLSSFFCCDKIKNVEKRQQTMDKGEAATVNVGILLIALIGGIAGILSTFYLLVAIPVVIIQKIIRKIRFGTPIMK